jgi:hypothetical protein
MNPRRLLLILASAVSLLMTAGCSAKVAGRPKVVPASGRVLYNGQPLEGAHVTFTNPTAKRSAYAQTDANGQFSLTTFERQDGAVPGKQQISVSKVKMTSQLDPGVDRTTVAPATKSTTPERRWLIPERYGDVATSGLTAEISEDGKNDTIVVDLHGSADKGSTGRVPAAPVSQRPDR